jgi:uncharacterized membrane protein AbrB (regulator of aidB expression)
VTRSRLFGLWLGHRADWLAAWLVGAALAAGTCIRWVFGQADEALR